MYGNTQILQVEYSIKMVKSKIRKYTQYFESIKWHNSGDAIMFMLEIVVSLADRIENYEGKLMQYT